MTDIPLEKHLDRRIKDLERFILMRFAEVDRAVSVHEKALTIRLENSNGLIEQMREQAQDFARKPELRALAERVDRVESCSSERTGRAEGVQPFLAIGVSVGMVLFSAVVAYVVTKLSVP